MDVSSVPALPQGQVAKTAVESGPPESAGEAAGAVFGGIVAAMLEEPGSASMRHAERADPVEADALLAPPEDLPGGEVLADPESAALANNAAQTMESRQTLAAGLQTLPPADVIESPQLKSESPGATTAKPLLETSLPGHSRVAITSEAPVPFETDVRADSLRNRTAWNPEISLNAPSRDLNLFAEVASTSRDSSSTHSASGATETNPAGTVTGRSLEQIPALQAAPSAAGKLAALPAAQPELFGERLSQQLTMMVSQNSQHARLAINPAELGPVEVRVSVVADEATVQLAAASLATRELLEDAMPRLRAAFAESGVSLGSADVFTELPDRGRDNSPVAGESRGIGSDEPVSDEASVSADGQTISLGLIDAFV